MADIELVIKIPEEVYQEVVNADKVQGRWGNDLLGILCAGIATGTQLSKGHGRLIDADALEKRMIDREIELGDDEAMWESSVVEVSLDMFAPTILEAYEPESEE